MLPGSGIDNPSAAGDGSAGLPGVGNAHHGGGEQAPALAQAPQAPAAGGRLMATRLPLRLALQHSEAAESGMAESAFVSIPASSSFLGGGAWNWPPQLRAGSVTAWPYRPDVAARPQPPRDLWTEKAMPDGLGAP